MASPVGHGLVGVAIARTAGKGNGAPDGGLYLLGVFAALAPDLDFVPGILRGAPGLYHQSVSHSLGAAVLFAAVVAGVAYLSRETARSTWTAAAVAGLSYASHLLVDLMGRHGRGPGGQPLLWPVDPDPVGLGLRILPGVEHLGPAAGLESFVSALISWRNLAAMGVEVVVLAPVCLAIVWLAERGGR